RRCDGHDERARGPCLCAARPRGARAPRGAADSGGGRRQRAGPRGRPGLALACDLVVAADRARLGLPETNLGLIPGFGGTQRLPRRVGLGRARELIYLGRIVTAEQALSMGLVDRVVPAAELETHAAALAAEL